MVYYGNTNIDAWNFHLNFLRRLILEQEIDGHGFEENTLFGNLNNY